MNTTFELNRMRGQLESFRMRDGGSYRLIPLPMPSPKWHPESGKRLPATYANFLITKGSVIYPTYSVKEDREAGDIFKSLFPDRGDLYLWSVVDLIIEGGESPTAPQCKITLNYPSKRSCVQYILY